MKKSYPQIYIKLLITFSLFLIACMVYYIIYIYIFRRSSSRGCGKCGKLSESLGITIKLSVDNLWISFHIYPQNICFSVDNFLSTKLSTVYPQGYPQEAVDNFPHVTFLQYFCNICEISTSNPLLIRLS